MTIKEAVEELIQSEEFNQAAKKDVNARMFLSKFRRKMTMLCSEVGMLIRFGYEFEVKKKNSSG